MKLTRRLLSTAVALALCLPTTLGIASCDKHTHTFGEWTLAETSANCNGGTFTRTCSGCTKTETRLGTENDHAWDAGYTYDDAKHWVECTLCHEKREEKWHTDNGSGECGICGGLIPSESVYYEISQDGTYAIVTGYDETETDFIVIAPTYEGLPVQEIKASAFEACSRLARVNLPDGITHIGANAFNGCERLLGIYLNNNVISVGENAFAGCSELVIFIQAEHLPSSWHENWNPDGCSIIRNHTGERATPVSAKALPIASSALKEEEFDKKQVTTNPNLNGVRAPEGFSTLTRYDSKLSGVGEWLSGNLWYYNWNSMKLTDYKEVWFAVKMENCFWAFVHEGDKNRNPSWLYIYMKQTGETEDGFTSWRIEASVGGQVYSVIENQSGRYIDDNRPTNSIPRLLWDEGYGSEDKNAILIYLYENDKPATLYFTEVMGIKAET